MNEVVLVGTSDAFGSAGRRQSAYLVRAASGSVLLDCGSTTNGGFAALGIERDEVDAIALSHFHGDHFGGIPLFLLAARYQDERRRPLRIAGPPGTEHRVRSACAALGHPLESSSLGFLLSFQELQAGRAEPVGPVEIRSFETHHDPAARPHGLRVRAGARQLVYSGDTGWFDALPERAAGADLFLCECTFPDPRLPYHLSLEQLALRREAFDCGRLLLTHLGREMRALGEHAGFEVADDGRRIRL